MEGTVKLVILCTLSILTASVGGSGLEVLGNKTYQADNKARVLAEVVRLREIAPPSPELTHIEGLAVVDRVSPTKEEITAYIASEAQINGISVETALRIADCESRFNPRARNPISSATGIYQFLRGTWDWFCEGDVYDYRDNVDCFMRYYKDHPNWWECR